MPTPILGNNDSWKLVLQEIWSQYRSWAKTAGAFKSTVTNWRHAILSLSILGAILGTLSQQLNLWNLLQAAPWLPPVVGFCSGAALGLAALFARSALSPDSESNAVRARSAAEGFKSEAYRLAAKAPPYDTATTIEELRERTDKITKAVANLAPKPISSEEMVAGMPTEPLTIEAYISTRVDDQIVRFYLPKARQYETKIANARRFTLALGAVAFLLGLGSAKFASVAGWIAVIGTVTAAVAALQYSARYQFLLVTYQATAARLRSLKTDWGVERLNDPNGADKKFIVACEETFSSENTAWMAEFTKRPTQ